MNQNLNLNHFTYDLMDNLSVSQYAFCGSIEINRNNTFLLATAKAITKVYVFKVGNLKFVSCSIGHNSYIYTLKFLNNKQHFLSGSLDKSIIIQSIQQLANSKYIQKLKEHKGALVTLVTHPTIENLFISASNDQIIFYSHFSDKQWFCINQINEIKGIFGLSINQNGTKLVVCSEYHQIVVLECVQQSIQLKFNENWIVKQNIKVQQWGFRACFLDNDRFAFQPVSQNWNGTSHLDIYSLNKQNNYIREKTIPVQGGGELCSEYGPYKYNKLKSILLIKNGNYINLFKYNQGKFNLRFRQSISFDTPEINGTLSEDGQYLITWDKKLRQIQIRKYIELNKAQVQN